MLEILQFSTLSLFFLTEDIQKKIIYFSYLFRRAVKTNGKALPWDVSDVCDRAVILYAIKHPEGFGFPNCSWRKSPQRDDEEIASRENQPHPENVFYTNYDCYNPRNRMVRKN